MYVLLNAALLNSRTPHAQEAQSPIHCAHAALAAPAPVPVAPLQSPLEGSALCESITLIFVPPRRSSLLFRLVTSLLNAERHSRSASRGGRVDRG